MPFSGEDSPSTDNSHFISLLPEVCRSVIFWATLYIVYILGLHVFTWNWIIFASNNCIFYTKISFPKGVRSILESSEKNDVFLIIDVRKVAG